MLVFVCKCSVRARACVRACEMECGITFLVIFFEKRLRMQLYSDVGPPGSLKCMRKFFLAFRCISKGRLSKMSTKGSAFNWVFSKCPRKALPLNVFLRDGCSKTSTKDVVDRLAFLRCPWKALPARISKRTKLVTQSAFLKASFPRYPRKALPANWLFSDVHERLCLQMYFVGPAFPRRPRKNLSTGWLF